MIYTLNFHPNLDPKLKCTCGHPDCDKRSVTQRALNKLQNVRDDYGKPMTVTSGGRCPNHPNEVHRAQPADHQKCTGIDIAYEGQVELTKLLVLAGRHGATRVAFGDNFVHMAWTPTEDRSVPSWTY